MVQQVQFILKKEIKMKQSITFLIAFLIASLQLAAQNCIDTAHIKGYYVVKKIASELTPEIKKKENVTVIEQRIDVHRTASFIPCDSITKKHPLSYWLNHFFDNTKQVFISCEKIGIKYLIQDCSDVSKYVKDTCMFPALKSKVLYKTTNFNTGDVFEIYYLDAHWAKVKIKKGTTAETMIPSRIAETSINPDIKEFDLYYFINDDKVDMAPKIKDSYIKVWKK
jgi:hypothetical protein